MPVLVHFSSWIKTQRPDIFILIYSNPTKLLLPSQMSHLLAIWSCPGWLWSMCPHGFNLIANPPAFSIPPHHPSWEPQHTLGLVILPYSLLCPAIGWISSLLNQSGGKREHVYKILRQKMLHKNDQSPDCSQLSGYRNQHLSNTGQSLHSA